LSRYDSFVELDEGTIALRCGPDGLDHAGFNARPKDPTVQLLVALLDKRLDAARPAMVEAVAEGS
jgi:hypothetical protein